MFEGGLQKHFKISFKPDGRRSAILNIIKYFEMDLGEWIGLKKHERMVYKHSLMRSLYHKPQKPHIDFVDKDLPKESYFYNAIMPLTSKGSYLEVWNHPYENQSEPSEGQVLQIPYGSILIMEQDTVHAGAFKPDFFLGYERIGFHINRNSGKTSLPATQKINYRDFDKLLIHGSMSHCKNLCFNVSDTD